MGKATTITNPLSPNINIQILQTNLHTFPLRISWANLIKDHLKHFLFGDHLLILITFSLDNVSILLGGSWCLWLLGLKGFTNTSKQIGPGQALIHFLLLSSAILKCDMIVG